MKRFVFCLAVLFSAVAVFASTVGISGDLITGFISKTFHVPQPIALAIYTGLLTLILWPAIRFGLKKIPGGPEGFFGTIGWGFAAWLFGDGVRLEGSTDTAMLTTELSKKYPNMDIKPKVDTTIESSNSSVG